MLNNCTVYNVNCSSVLLILCFTFSMEQLIGLCRQRSRDP